ncbi:hypothetical protein ACRRTK_024587 [Alexandromys fortis]
MVLKTLVSQEDTSNYPGAGANGKPGFDEASMPWQQTLQDPASQVLYHRPTDPLLLAGLACCPPCPCGHSSAIAPGLAEDHRVQARDLSHEVGVTVTPIS